MWHLVSSFSYRLVLIIPLCHRKWKLAIAAITLYEGVYNATIFSLNQDDP